MQVATPRECLLMENLDDRAIGEVAEFFSAFAVPMRLKILNALRHGERNVGELKRVNWMLSSHISNTPLAVLEWDRDFRLVGRFEYYT